MWQRLIRFFGRKPAYRPGPPPRPRLVLTQSCLEALRTCLEPEVRCGHEGVAYLLGQTDGTVTLAVAAVRPEAVTTPGSFSVSAPAMANVVRTATKAGLQVVAQVHTHPGKAYHSDGDVEGARIVFGGFVSAVLPDYGRRLPGLDGSAVYMFRSGTGFVQVPADRIGILPGRLA
jgi:proteasome lid subunit RPN8/RPN11